MELFFGIISGLVILVILVIVHELGHAIVALRNGVVVEEFGIGFPPRAWKKKLKNGILLSVNWLPLGGFVKLQGEHDAARKKGDYGSATFMQKTRILLAGVVINWLFAVLLLTGLAIIGMPKVIPDQITIPSDSTVVQKPIELVAITKGYPAEKAGLIVGDQIIRFANKEVPTVDRLIEISKQNKGKDIYVVYSRNGSENTVRVTLRNDDKGGLFGASLGQQEIVKSTWSAPIVGIATNAQFTWLTLKGVGELLSSLVNGFVLQFSFDQNVREQASSELNTVSDSVAGPIGILGTIFPAAQQAGMTQLILLTAIISVSLAVMNALPIPSLDGGRWFTMVMFRLLKKKLTMKREEKIQLIGFSILMGLVVLVTIADVSKLF